MNRNVRRYIVVVSSAFGAAMVAALVTGQVTALAHPLRIAPLLGLCVASEALVVQQSRKAGANMSFSVTAHIAAAIAFGPLPAALVAAWGVLVVDGLRLQPRSHILINASMFGISIWAAGEAFLVAGGTIGPVTGAEVVPLVVLVAVRFLANSLIYCGASALARGARFVEVLREDLRDSVGPGVGEGCLGVLVAFGYSGAHWVILPFLAPLLAALYGSKQNFERLKGETADVLQNFARVIDERDRSTASHSERVAEYVERFVAAIGLPHREQERLVQTARFHDLGKITVDVATLSTKERLTELELRAIRRHPRLSARLLAPFHFAEEMALYAELHHERYDGRGYYGVPQREIPVEAHVLIVADSFDAMTSQRAYRPALSVQEAAQELRDKAGSQFHPLVAGAFATMVEGGDVASVMSPQQLAALRAEFSRIGARPLARLSGLVQPGLAAVYLAALSLVTFGVAAVPRPVPLALLAATAAAGALWAGRVASLRLRSRALRSALAGGRPLRAALTEAGIDAWTARLEWDADTSAYGVVDGSAAGASADALRDACIRALRPHGARGATLAGGGHLVLGGEDRARERIAFGVARRPSAVDRELLALAAELAEGEAPGAEVPLRVVAGGERSGAEGDLHGVCRIDLDAFERVRVAAGQLSAERVVEEAERRLRALLRSGDALVRIGEDGFGVVLCVADQHSLDAVCERIRDALAHVAMPRRVAALEPCLRAALGGAAAGRDPELRAILHRALGDAVDETERLAS